MCAYFPALLLPPLGDAREVRKMRLRLAPAINGHNVLEPAMLEFFGAAFGAAIAVAILAVAYERWGYAR